MFKNAAILEAVNYLLPLVEIEDYWDGDLDSVGVRASNDGHLVYINTYDEPYGNYLMQCDWCQDESHGDLEELFHFVLLH